MSAEPGDQASQPGVSRALARARNEALSDVRYHLELDVSDDLAVSLRGRLRVRFRLARHTDVIFDFVDPSSKLEGMRVGERQVDVRLEAEHFVVPAAVLEVGGNDLTFDFVADPAPLNRQPDLLYSLFVPARARLAFPCFDQPDIKARFSLTLDVPATWNAVSNAPVEDETVTNRRKRVRFRETEPIPTYLFAFAAGLLTGERIRCDGRELVVWHREHDQALVARNLPTIVDLHAHALSWLEAYTDVPYPFSQCAMVLVPSFQFSGMEHPGAIFYNAGRLLLESSASEHDALTRASLIAHETAHIWFGDFVTMRWFDDVWLKEVFANFVAEKIVADMFPHLDHAVRFFQANHPPAYAVDRTSGANAIRQELENLADAGQLYGPIIYLKAPIVFSQLESALGAERFRDGVRRYLRAHRFANADWHDLLAHLSSGGSEPLEPWSRAWIEEAGRPRIRIEQQHGPDENLTGLVCRVEDPAGSERLWPQTLQIAIGYDDRVDRVPCTIRERDTSLTLSMPAPRFVLAGGGGVGYGEFPLDEDSRVWLLEHVSTVSDAVTRGVAWEALWDALLAGAVSSTAWLEAAVRALGSESEKQNVERLLATVSKAFWLFLSSTERESLAPRVEGCLRNRLSTAETSGERASWFAALTRLTTTDEGCARLEQVWNRTALVPGLTLGETDETTLAFELAIRTPSKATALLDQQAARVADPDRRARLAFVRPALSGDPAVREEAFERLSQRSNRVREPWVLSCLHYLSHPLHQAHARRFIEPGLLLLPELLRTGDIFFPTRWTEALLHGHSSPVAATIVHRILEEQRAFPASLRRTVLVASDLLFRVGRREGAILS